MRRRIVSVLIVTIGLATIAAWFIPHAMQKEPFLTACFDNASGLQANAPVRVAGVNVGTVVDVIARPERKDCPAEARIAITTSYELKIPDDAVARIESEGMLNPTFVDIDVRLASGPPVKNHGTLKTRPSIDRVKALDFLLYETLKDAEKTLVNRPSSPAK